MMRPGVNRSTIAPTICRTRKVAECHIRNIDRCSVLARIRAPHPLRIDVDHIGHVEELKVLKDGIANVALLRQQRFKLE